MTNDGSPTLAFVLSVLAHGALAGAAILFLERVVTPPSVDVSFGNGSTGDLVSQSDPPGDPQRPDAGSASQTPDRPHPSYNTLQALYALMDANTESSDPAITYQAPPAIQIDLSDAGPPLDWALASRNDADSAIPLQHPSRASAGVRPTGGDESSGSSARNDSQARAGGAGSDSIPSAHGANGTGLAGRLGSPAGLIGGHGIQPVYSDESRRHHEQGVVVLNIEILASGSVGRINVVSAPPYPRLVKAAIAAVRAAQFHPARDLSGHPVPMVVRQPISFHLRHGR